MKKKPYNPCLNGVHVCGADEITYEFFTEANFPGATGAQFEAARAECQCDGIPDDGFDFVVDFIVDGDTIDDFPMNRQMLPRLERALKPQSSEGAR